MFGGISGWDNASVESILKQDLILDKKLTQNSFLIKAINTNNIKYQKNQVTYLILVCLFIINLVMFYLQIWVY